MVGVELVREDGAPDAALRKRVLAGCRERGLLLLNCGPYDNVVRFIPPLVVDEEQVRQAVRIFEEALEHEQVRVTSDELKAFELYQRSTLIVQLHAMPSQQDYKLALQVFQSQRLRRDHADLAAEAQYHEIGEFFFEEMYGPHDFSARDEQARRLHQFVHLAPGLAVRDVQEVLELLELTQ